MEQDLSLLQNISDTLKTEPEASQRQLAQNAMVSIGLMNAILKRFVERGWIMLTNVNGRKLAYALTPQGINELYKRGKSFTERTFAAASEYNDVIYTTISNAKKNGKTKVILYGNSHIKFLIVYACEKCGLLFEEYGANNSIEENCFCIAGELNSADDKQKLVEAGCVDLVDLMIRV